MLNQSAVVYPTLTLFPLSNTFPSSFSYPNPRDAINILLAAKGCLYLNSTPTSGTIE